MGKKLRNVLAPIRQLKSLGPAPSTAKSSKRRLKFSFKKAWAARLVAAVKLAILAQGGTIKGVILC